MAFHQCVAYGRATFTISPAPPDTSSPPSRRGPPHNTRITGRSRPKAPRIPGRLPNADPLPPMKPEAPPAGKQRSPQSALPMLSLREIRPANSGRAGSSQRDLGHGAGGQTNAHPASRQHQPLQRTNFRRRGGEVVVHVHASGQDPTPHAVASKSFS